MKKKKFITSLLIVAGVCSAVAPFPVHAEEISRAESQFTQTDWLVQCSSPARKSKLDCALEQRIITTNTGNLFVLASIKVPGETREPLLMLQVPLGLNLAAGVTVKIDKQFEENYQVQTCEQTGCYVGGKASEKLLAAMEKGASFNVILQSNNKKEIVVSMPLSGFKASYDKIK
jgi:invasion protein IalB